MSSGKTSFTLTYKKPGTAPPLFLAGSFSDPQWQPKEMECTTDSDGEHSFRSDVVVEPGKDYQFKLRIGPGDWWVLSEDFPIVTDDSGNTNNVLNISSSPEENNDAQADKGTTIEAEPSQPIPKTKVAIPKIDDKNDTEDDLKTPLFAHERLGAYNFGEEESEEEACPSIPIRRDAKLRSDITTADDVDINDPTLEKFPSDRTSVLDALRTIQTHLDEDHTHLDDIPASPRVVSYSRSNSDAVDDTTLSQASLSPDNMRKREQRLSHSSFGRTRSAISLGSIAEEPKQDESDLDEPSPGEMIPDTKESKEAQSPPVITLTNPNNVTPFEEPRSPPSEEDEAVVMKDSKPTSNGKASNATSARSGTDELDQERKTEENETTPEASQDDIEEVTSRFEVDEAKDHPALSIVNEQDSTRLSNGSDNDQKDTDRPIVSRAHPHVDVIHGQAVLRKWLQGLLNGALSNKLPIILTTGVVALAMGISWWNSRSST